MNDFSPEKLLEIWYQIGSKNPWIKEADDPPFTKAMLVKCNTIDELIAKFKHGNWCLGQGFFYRNICFINQIDGGDEYLVLRDNISFESFSSGAMIKKNGEEYFKRHIFCIIQSTPQELKKLDYMDHKDEYTPDYFTRLESAETTPTLPQK